MLRDPVRIDRVLRARDEVECILVRMDVIVWFEPGNTRNHPPCVANWEPGMIWPSMTILNVHRTVRDARFLGSDCVD